MSRIDTCCATAGIDSWIQRNHSYVKGHVAWKGDLQEDQSEMLLKDEVPLTYLLRNGEKEHVYFITFVTSEGLIKHQRFVLEVDRQGWHYRNGAWNDHVEALADTVEGLIPMMMHCERSDCKPFLKK